jgi:hypothetical protein
MTIFKNIKNGLLYIIYSNSIKNTYTAMPFLHKGNVISECNIEDFVVSKTTEGRLDGFL